MTKILLVEDDKSLREIYGVRLLAEGYDIVSAGDGEEALAMAIKERPELIVSDVMMPKISGFDMLDILRSTTETRDIKVIMMTALSSDDQRTRGEQLGADRYLVKSQVGIEDVVRTVHEVLGDAPAASEAAPAPQADQTQIAPAAPVPSDFSQPQPAAEPVVPQPDVATQPQATDAVDTTPEGYDPLSLETPPLPPQPTAMQHPTGTPPVADITPTPAPAPEAPAAPISAPVVTEPAVSTLPRPTAPFSSPRPTNLGERVIHPLESAEPTVSSTVSSQIEQELQAAADPVSSQADELPEAPAPEAAPQQQFDAPQPIDATSAPAYEETPRPEAEPQQPTQPQQNPNPFL